MNYDYEKIVCLNKQKTDLMKKMWQEKEYKKKKAIEYKVKIIDLKIAIEKLKA
jgi:hypothetical protein